MNLADGLRGDFETLLLQTWKNKPDPLLRHVERMIEDVLNRFDPAVSESHPRRESTAPAAGQG